MADSTSRVGKATTPKVANDKVIEADPDVPHAFAGVVDELLQAAGFFERELLPARFGAEDCRAHLPTRFQLQKPPVLRVDVGKQPVAEGQLLGALLWIQLRAGQGQLHHGISAVAVSVDQLIRHAEGAVHAVRLHGQAGQRIGRDFGMFGAGFAPGDIAVAVGIEPDGKVKIAQGDVPLAGDTGCPIDLEGEVAVGRFVGHGRHHDRCQQHEQDARPLHGLPFNCCASVCKR